LWEIFYIIENLIKQDERRLKTIEGFGKNQKATEGYLNLMGIYQCFSARGGSAFGRKPHTDWKNKNRYKNGKSPLKLAGISIKGRDWIRFALKNNPVNITLQNLIP